MATQVQFGDDNRPKSDLRLLSADEIAGAKKESDKYGAGAKLFSDLASSVDTGNFMGNPVYTGGKDALQGFSLMLGFQAQREAQKASTIEDLGKQEESLTEDFIKSSLIRTSDAPANMEGDKDDEYSRDALSALAGKSQEGLEHIALEAHNGVGFARVRGFDGNYYRVPISNEEFLSLAKMREKARLDRERYAYREKRKQYGLEFLPEFAVSLNLDPNEEGLIRGILNSGEAPRGFFETIQQMKINGEDVLPYLFSQGHNSGVSQYRKYGHGKTVTNNLLNKERELRDLNKAYVADGMVDEDMALAIDNLREEVNDLSDYQTMLPMFAEQGGDMLNLVTQAKLKNKSMDFLLDTLESSAASGDGGGINLYKKTKGAYTSKDIEDILQRINNINNNMGFSQPLNEADLEELRVALHDRFGVTRDASQEEENKKKFDLEKDMMEKMSYEQSTLKNPIPPNKEIRGANNTPVKMPVITSKRPEREYANANGTTRSYGMPNRPLPEDDVMLALRPPRDELELRKKATSTIFRGATIDGEFYSTGAGDEDLLNLPKEKIKMFADSLLNQLVLQNQAFGMSQKDAEEMAIEMLLEDAPQLLELYQG